MASSKSQVAELYTLLMIQTFITLFSPMDGVDTVHFLIAFSAYPHTIYPFLLVVLVIVGVRYYRMLYRFDELIFNIHQLPRELTLVRQEDAVA